VDVLCIWNLRSHSNFCQRILGRDSLVPAWGRAGHRRFLRSTVERHVGGRTTFVGLFCGLLLWVCFTWGRIHCSGPCYRSLRVAAYVYLSATNLCESERPQVGRYRYQQSPAECRLRVESGSLVWVGSGRWRDGCNWGGLTAVTCRIVVAANADQE
jgi:hypothetical protein